MDINKEPRRISEWTAVLDAVYRADASDEQTWLEWKSTLNLRSKADMATIVAKAIIAMANRDPDKAAATVGDHLLICSLPADRAGRSATANVRVPETANVAKGPPTPRSPLADLPER